MASSCAFPLSKAMEFRFDFSFRVFMDFAYYGIQIAFYNVIFLQTTALGGWNRDQALVFMGGYLVVDGIAMTFFSNNLWWLPTAVNRGDLDYYLTRPVSSLFFLTLRDFPANSLINLVFALGILAWAVWRPAAGSRARRLRAFPRNDRGGASAARPSSSAAAHTGFLDPLGGIVAWDFLQPGPFHGEARWHLHRLDAALVGDPVPLLPDGFLPGAGVPGRSALGSAPAFRRGGGRHVLLRRLAVGERAAGIFVRIELRWRTHPYPRPWPISRAPDDCAASKARSIPIWRWPRSIGASMPRAVRPCFSAA